MPAAGAVTLKAKVTVPAGATGPGTSWRLKPQVVLSCGFCEPRRTGLAPPLVRVQASATGPEPGPPRCAAPDRPAARYHRERSSHRLDSRLARGHGGHRGWRDRGGGRGLPGRARDRRTPPVPDGDFDCHSLYQPLPDPLESAIVRTTRDAFRTAQRTCPEAHFNAGIYSASYFTRIAR